MRNKRTPNPQWSSNPDPLHVARNATTRLRPCPNNSHPPRPTPITTTNTRANSPSQLSWHHQHHNQQRLSSKFSSSLPINENLVSSTSTSRRNGEYYTQESETSTIQQCPVSKPNRVKKSICFEKRGRKFDFKFALHRCPQVPTTSSSSSRTMIKSALINVSLFVYFEFLLCCSSVSKRSMALGLGPVSRHPVSSGQVTRISIL